MFVRTLKWSNFLAESAEVLLSNLITNEKNAVAKESAESHGPDYAEGGDDNLMADRRRTHTPS